MLWCPVKSFESRVHIHRKVRPIAIAIDQSIPHVIALIVEPKVVKPVSPPLTALSSGVKTSWQLRSVFKNLWKIYLRNLSNIKWKIYQKYERNVSNTEISQLQKTHYKSPCNWIKSSVSSMTSAEEGQPPSNEPEEWQDTHPLSPLRWGTTLLTR